MKSRRKISIGINWEQSSTAALMINNSIAGCVNEERSRPEHLWKKDGKEWKLKKPIWETL
mgnify:CR=1 FL=1